MCPIADDNDPSEQCPYCGKLPEHDQQHLLAFWGDPDDDEESGLGLHAGALLEDGAILALHDALREGLYMTLLDQSQAYLEGRLVLPEEPAGKKRKKRQPPMLVLPQWAKGDALLEELLAQVRLYLRLDGVDQSDEDDWDEDESRFEQFVDEEWPDAGLRDQAVWTALLLKIMAQSHVRPQQQDIEYLKPMASESAEAWWAPDAAATAKLVGARLMAMRARIPV
jgi:hypothetical protein